MHNPYTHNSSDPYVKIRLIHKGTRQSKWKTSIKRRTLNPEYKESFLFDVTHMELRDISFEILIMDYDRFTANDLVGVVYIGGHVVQESGRTHWSNVLSSPLERISSWHYILPTSIYKTYRSGKKLHH